MALTGRDEDNLIACQLAQRVFKIKSPICRVNNPRNLATIRSLGILNTFSSTILLAKKLNQEIDYSGLYLVYDIPGNSKAIVEFLLSPEAEENGKALKDCTFPKDSRVVLITHGDGQVELAQGESVINAHDRIMMVCDYEDFPLIHERLVADTLPENIPYDLLGEQNDHLLNQIKEAADQNQSNLK